MVKAKKVVKEAVVPLPKAPSEERHPRMLIVEFIGDTPKYVFKGDWGIRNFLILKRCLSREFKLYRRSVLRTAITNKETII